jgi:hypothetical protein
MKYYLYLQKSHGRTSNYFYWIIVSDEPLIKLDIWCNRKSFNCTIYNEIQVLEIIQHMYPEAIRIPQPTHSRWKHLKKNKDIDNADSMSLV